MDNNFENIETLIISYLSGNASQEEKVFVEKWLSESDENKKEFAQVADVWEASGANKPIFTDTDKKYESLKSRIKGEHRFKPVFSYFMRYAAIFIFALALGGFLTYYLGVAEKEQVNLIGENKIVVPHGSKSNLILPDGSQVWLNAGSNISYSDGFNSGDKRELMLIGEAFFKVTENKEKPFIVKTKDAVVRALGTSFNVKAYPDDLTVEATLVEGSIAVSKTSNISEEVILKPNQQIIIGKESQVVKNLLDNTEKIHHVEKVAVAKGKVLVQKNVNVPKYTSWKENEWIIENEKLGSLAKKLERRYAVNIIFNKEEHSEIRFSGTLPEESLEQVLEVISFASPVSFTVDGKTVIFDSK